MGLARKIKNTLNHLPHVLGAINFGTILDGIATTADTAAAGVTDLQTYSDTPVQIGTWNGTPVWRANYEVDIASSFTEKMYDTMLEDRLFVPDFSGYVKDMTAVYMLDGICIAQPDPTDLTKNKTLPIDVSIVEGDIFAFRIPELGVLPFDYSSLTGDEKIIGYIIFVTPATNIAEPEESEGA